jgi:hypothetical protein
MQPKLALASAPCVELTDEQIEVIGQINDLAYEHPNETLEQLMQRVGIQFVGEPTYGAFVVACGEIFKRERCKD